MAPVAPNVTTSPTCILEPEADASATVNFSVALVTLVKSNVFELSGITKFNSSPGENLEVNNVESPVTTGFPAVTLIVPSPIL